MFGTSIGFTLGGLTGDKFGTPAPFQVTYVPHICFASIFDASSIADLALFSFSFCLLVCSTLFSRFCLPFVSPAASVAPPTSTEGDKESTFSFLHCLKVFLPTEQPDGQGRRFWGLTLLGTGCFMAVLATAYVVSLQKRRGEESGLTFHLHLPSASDASTHRYQQLRFPSHRERIPVSSSSTFWSFPSRTEI